MNIVYFSALTSILVFVLKLNKNENLKNPRDLGNTDIAAYYPVVGTTSSCDMTNFEASCGLC